VKALDSGADDYLVQERHYDHDDSSSPYRPACAETSPCRAVRFRSRAGSGDIRHRQRYSSRDFGVASEILSSAARRRQTD